MQYYRSFRAVQVHMLKDHLGTKVSTQSLISHLVSAEAIVPLDRLNWERIKLETTSSLDYAARYDDVIHEVSIITDNASAIGHCLNKTPKKWSKTVN